MRYNIHFLLLYRFTLTLEAVPYLSKYISITKFRVKEKSSGSRVAIYGQMLDNIVPFVYEN